jgi:hypothetical protein
MGTGEEEGTGERSIDRLQTKGEEAETERVKRAWREPVVGSLAEILERVPPAKADGRYSIPGAREILADYWFFVSLTNRRPTRAEMTERMPRWKTFFRDFRDLERVTGVIWEKTKKGWKKRGGLGWLGEKRGLPLMGRSMTLEPVNEQGVVMLFGEMAKELGFVIERVGTGFPDCIAARKVGGEWKTVRIEFEFVTSRFDHDPAGCDLVVCWEHDWKECPVEVMELREMVGSLRGPGGKAAECGVRNGGGRRGCHPLGRLSGVSKLREPGLGVCRIEEGAASGR